MANDAESEQNQKFAYTSVKKRLSDKYAESQEQAKEKVENVNQTQSTEQPLDLSQMSPKSNSTDSSSSKMDSFSSEESQSNGKRSTPSPMEEGLRRVKEENGFGCTQNGTRNGPTDVLQKSRSPVPNGGNGIIPNTNGHVMVQGMVPQIPVSTMAMPMSHPQVSPAMITPMHEQSKGAKSTRPFKAYPNDPISVNMGYFPSHMQSQISSSPLLPSDVLTSYTNNERFIQFRSQMLEQKYATGRRMQNIVNPRTVNGSRGQEVNSPRVPEVNGHSEPRNTNGGNTPNDNPIIDSIQNNDSNESAPDSTPSRDTTQSSAPPKSTPNGNSNGRKRSRNGEEKDDGYWERRRKNNEAAKRSRDARRAKEDEIAIRAAFLEQENLRLKIQLAALTSGKGFPEDPINHFQY